jgi:nicotinamidase-related amidase
VSSRRELPLPPHFQATHAGVWAYRPDAQKLFADALAWREAHALAASAADKIRVHLLLIDLQRDFCFPEGTLYVAGRSGRGAIDDNERIARFVYRNLPALTDITTTLDTHFAFQIFFPSFWVDADGRPLPPHREIVADDIDAGRVRPNPGVAGWLSGGDTVWLERQARHYCAELEKAGKYKLYLWPPHCLLGSDGHSLAGVIHEARLFHAFARGAQSRCEVKGGNPLTENYSVFRPEVLTRFDGQPLAERNAQLLETLIAGDAVIIAGQASSHCVKSSIEDLLQAIQSANPALARKVYLMTDCMSAVTVPDGKGGLAADFTLQAEAALQRFAEAGMHLVKSTEPLAAWEGFPESDERLA